MRLFVAVDLADDVRHNAARAVRGLRERLERAETVAVSWVGVDNYHLTLRFFGEVDDSTARQVEASLSPSVAVAPFDVQLAGAGVFPPAGAARVVWLGIKAGMEGLTLLYDEVARRVSPRFPPDDRPYRAHLTVGRFRVPAPSRVRETIATAHVGAIGECTIRHVTLYRSQLTPKGAIYTPIVRAPLVGPTP